MAQPQGIFLGALAARGISFLARRPLVSGRRSARSKGPGRQRLDRSHPRRRSPLLTGHGGLGRRRHLCRSLTAPDNWSADQQTKTRDEGGRVNTDKATRGDSRKTE